MNSLKGPWGPPEYSTRHISRPVRGSLRHASLTFVGRLLLTADRQFQHFSVPADASIQVGHGEGWGQTARNRWHGLILPICVVGRLSSGSMVRRICGRLSRTSSVVSREEVNGRVMLIRLGDGITSAINSHRRRSLYPNRLNAERIRA
jgi:hypothetical protein